MFAALGPLISTAAKAFLPALGKSVGNLVVNKVIPGIANKIGTFSRRHNLPVLNQAEKFTPHIQQIAKKGILKLMPP